MTALTSRCVSGARIANVGVRYVYIYTKLMCIAEVINYIIMYWSPRNLQSAELMM